MKSLLALLLLTAASSVAAAGDGETFTLSGEDATAFDGDGLPMFRAGQPFLLDYLGTQGQVFEVKAGKVRISPDGTSQVWLQCSELKPLSGCSQEAATANQRSRSGTRGAGIPNCPGDPRCPRKGSK
ncbi:hypothetical protein [Altererythrobacter fulvus]|uniref:hypothetical protein n=1 Tax=Caenibius fulvus TaxID=2126012 RepID=UPI00301651D4